MRLAVALLLVGYGFLMLLFGAGMAGELDGHNDIAAELEGWSPLRRKVEWITAWALGALFASPFLWIAWAIIREQP